jgi:hypothetical protein
LCAGLATSSQKASQTKTMTDIAASVIRKTASNQERCFLKDVGICPNVSGYSLLYNLIVRLENLIVDI